MLVGRTLYGAYHLTWYCPRKKRINIVTQLHSVPDSFDELSDCTVIFAAMILLFEDAKTPLSRFYPVIHNAEMAFEELRQKGNRFASIFYQWLLAKTINSEYGVIWAFAYLTTPKGLIYAREAIHNREFPPPANGYTSLFYDIEKPKDPIDDVTEILIEERVNVAVEEILTEAPEARWPEKRS